MPPDSRMQRRYRNASREIKRLTSITKSPIFSVNPLANHCRCVICLICHLSFVICARIECGCLQHFGETLSGLSCVRAFGGEERFMDRSDGVRTHTEIRKEKATVLGTMAAERQGKGSVLVSHHGHRVAVVCPCVDGPRGVERLCERLCVGSLCLCRTLTATCDSSW